MRSGMMFSVLPFVLSIFIMPILHVEKLRHREVETCLKVGTVNQDQLTTKSRS